MADYNYYEGKQRIEEILDSSNDTIQSDRIPKNSAFSYDNGYYGFVTAIFVDICDSTKFFNDGLIKRTTKAKIIRSFTSEIIEILRKDDNLRDIGIRGDCVFAIYTSPSYVDDYEVFDKAVYINTFGKMLNTILKKRNMPQIRFGIGISTGNDLVVKAGRENTGINDLIWIGEAVTYASHLSGLANRNNLSPILISDCFFKNIQHAMEKSNPYATKQEWFNNFKHGEYSGKQCDIIKTSMIDWIDKGMPNEQ